jgi:transposase InsO family protein
MKRRKKRDRVGSRKAELRFAVIGGLLGSPPGPGEVGEEFNRLASKVWFDPVTGSTRRFARSTIERWYYKARRSQSPVDILKTKQRIDKGTIELSGDLIDEWKRLYESHSHWSVLLLYGNFKAWARHERKPPLLRVPSYSTMRRFYVRSGWVRHRKPRTREDGSVLPASVAAEARRLGIEIRSFENDYIGGLWHLDFHKGTRAILLEDGSWQMPLMLAVMDDRSRLICHGQWYLSESTESLVHGFIQAVQKRGLCRALMSDNGSAMKSEEFVQGLVRLSIGHELTLRYSPYQNGKQEKFWQQVEGRLMKMIEAVQPMTLGTLNDLTQIWLEGEYNRNVHSEIKTTPINRFASDPSVLRNSPSSDDLRSAFVCEVDRLLRKTDGTMSLDGVRFEIPSAYRHHRNLLIHYTSWDLSYVFLVDPVTLKSLARIYPLNRSKNNSGKRAAHSPVNRQRVSAETLMKQLPAQMRHLLKQSQMSHMPPAYVPQTDDKNE